MSGIQSSVGLISGIDYTSLVNELIAIDSIPMNRLVARTEVLATQKEALESLNLLLLTSTYTINNLNRPEPFNRVDPTSSNEAVLKATKSSGGQPAAGSYTFTPIRSAQSQQTIAQGVASATEALGRTGTITIGRGWSMQKEVNLSEINGGAGFTKGQIRITDGAGARAAVDLRNATTIDDVINAINGTTSIDVFAEVIEDRIVLTDMSGVAPADSKFIVQDISGGSTAASLGLANKTVDASGIAVGDSIYRLGEDTRLSQLNDGMGIVTDNLIGDLSITCKDGSRVAIDFNRHSTTEEIGEGAPENHTELTLGDLIETINNSVDANGNAGKIRASISSDGKRLVLTDTTSKMIENPDYDPDAEPGDDNPAQIADPDAKTIISQVSSNPVLKSLGFTGDNDTTTLESTDGTFASRFLIGGLSSPLLSSINGGNGISSATAGGVEVQDRAGNTAVISFTKEELDLMQTVEDAVYVLNYKLATAERDGSTEENPLYGIGIEVRLNDAKTGFQLVDTTGRADANMIFRDVVTETTETVTNEEGVEEEVVTGTVDPRIAASLGLNVDSGRATVDGGSLNRQVFSYNTKLSELNGGRGVTMTGARISITGSSGRTETFAFDANRHQTLGDVIKELNRNGLGMTARLNDTGDGILLQDRTNGNGSFSVVDADSTSKFAETLGIAGIAPADSKVDGVLSIDGSQTHRIEIEATDTLEDVQQKINDAGGNFSATIVTDGSDTPYRLSITGSSTGVAGAMNIDLSALGLKTENMTEARDAALVFGESGSNAGVMLHSGTNTFKNVVNGLDLTLGSVPDPPTPVTITCEKTAVDIQASLEAFVTNYNQFKQTLNQLTSFEAGDDGVTGYALYNNAVARTMDRELVDHIQKRVYGIPGITSLASLGVTVRSSLGDDGQITATGTLQFDLEVFEAAYELNPDGVRDFFYQTITEVGESGKENEVKTGWAQSFMTAAEKVTGNSTGNILGKVYTEMQTLQSKIDQNTERAEFMQARLDVKKQQMLNKFYAMEQALARMSSDMNTVSGIATSWAQNLGNTGMGGYGTGTYA